MAADVIQAPKPGASNPARRHTRAARHDDHQSLLLFCYRRPGRRDFRFHSIEIEACALLHWRELDRSHGQLLHLVLNEYETPEFVLEPVKVLLRPVFSPAIRPARALERIETKVGQKGYVRLGLVTYPAAGLVDEAVLVIIEAHGTQLAFAEIPDLVPVRRSPAGDHVHLVIAIQITLVGTVTDLLTLLQLFANVRVAGSGKERRKPVQPGDNTVLDLPGRHLARPADQAGHAEAAFHDGAFALRERRLSAVWPGEYLSAVVGGEDDDGVVVDAHVLELLHHDADVVVELRHAGLMDAPAVLGVAERFVLRRQMRDDMHPSRVEP